MRWGGRQVARGELGDVITGKEVVRRGRREDLWAVWGSVEIGWEVDGVDIDKTNGEEEGWGRIKKMIM